MKLAKRPARKLVPIMPNGIGIQHRTRALARRADALGGSILRCTNGKDRRWALELPGGGGSMCRDLVALERAVAQAEEARA